MHSINDIDTLPTPQISLSPKSIYNIKISYIQNYCNTNFPHMCKIRALTFQRTTYSLQGRVRAAARQCQRYI